MVRKTINPISIRKQHQIEMEKPIRKVSDKQKSTLEYRAKIKPIILKEQGGKCNQCGTAIPDFRGWQLVHIKSLSLGGTDDRENLEVDCAKCHFTKWHNLREV